MPDVKSANVLFLDGRYREAAAMYAEGASDGDAECAHNYAYCLLYGIGTEKNEQLAKSYFVFASAKVPAASYNLAVMYLHGTGVPRNYKKTYEYMYDAARGGIIEAETYLGIAHTLGSLFEPDVVCISLIPYHTEIMREEGLLLDGEVAWDESDEEAKTAAVRQDPREAFEWFKLAAAHPSDYVEDMACKSKYLYARCFLDSLGTDFNRDRANSLMLVAAKEGSREAAYYLETDAPYMLASLDDVQLIDKIRRLERLG
ncbi:MAG: sel1 repeat family protein [Clostridia bacterium]|nr:sel1 repeat family protein [Clostridia bacterium]